ncbi:tail fiber protein [Methylobacter sp.]|uniref:phage tail protein n=1 Tax=Methylobacter sp. TaxID=2051955 RepID=UPI002489D72D|nr:tail fiber protein [Methylobacter sp.]MDI1277193.1 tail fiber protein [Methylobacter sp.]MDI1360045.1 tail fiber protein [Methylobacter sp.]
MDAFIGTVMAVGFNYPPRGWLFCNGQTVPVQQNAALFALLGTMYGGDGQNTFGIPDLRGRVVVGSQAQGPGLMNVPQGTKAGTNTATVISTGAVSFTIGINNLPQHNHSVSVPGSAFTASSKLNATSDGPGSPGPVANATLCNTGSGGTSGNMYLATTGPATDLVALNSQSVTTTLVGSANVNSGTTGSGTAVSAPVTTSANISNMQPYLGLNYIICSEGIYPSRN